MSKPIESAEEFARTIVWECASAISEVDREVLAELLEARDNAVRLALLDELEAAADADSVANVDDGCWVAARELRAKHGKP